MTLIKLPFHICSIMATGFVSLDICADLFGEKYKMYEQFW